MKYAGPERRRKPRLLERFPATVRAIDKNGVQFEARTLLVNLSSSGLYMKLARELEPGSRPFIVMELPGAERKGERGGQIALRGVVWRVEPQPDGRYGIAVFLTRYRFI